jgi:hypothetical protein
VTPDREASMSRKRVSLILLVYLGIVWGAIVVRSDRFPLTWAPIYSRIGKPRTQVSSKVIDHDAINRGLLVTLRDGSTDYVGREELNIPRGHIYRLYYSRSHNKPAAKHANANRNLSAFNRFIRGLGPDELAIPNDTAFHLFRTLNQTLGREPDDPDFIVRIQASYERIYRSLDDLSKVWRKSKHGDLRWDEAWRERW